MGGTLGGAQNFGYSLGWHLVSNGRKVATVAKSCRLADTFAGRNQARRLDGTEDAKSSKRQAERSQGALPLLPMASYADEPEIDKLVSSFRRDFDSLTPQHQKSHIWLFRALVSMTRDRALGIERDWRAQS
jgi:hypothetical protein